MKRDEIWVGRCEWGIGAYFTGCGYWVDVRVRPLPIAVEAGASTETLGAVVVIPRPMPAVWPATTIQAQLLPDPDRHEGKREKLRCTANGMTIEQPAVGDEVWPHSHHTTLHGRSDLVWLSTEPPIFELSDWDNCAPCPDRVVFEGCTRSTRYGAVQVGPDGVMAFHVDGHDTPWELSNRTLLRHGPLGTIERIRRDHFAFVPE